MAEGPGTLRSDRLVPEAWSWHLTVWGPKAVSSWVTGCWGGGAWPMPQPGLGEEGPSLQAQRVTQAGTQGFFFFHRKSTYLPCPLLASLGAQPSWR